MGSNPPLSALRANGTWKEHRSPSSSFRGHEQKDIHSLMSSKPHRLGSIPLTPTSDILCSCHGQVFDEKARWGKAGDESGPSQKGAAEIWSGPGQPGLEEEAHQQL